MSAFHTSFRREGWVWHWTLVYTDNEGVIEKIASGAKLRKSSARAAAQSWQRIAMRHRGLL